VVRHHERFALREVTFGGKTFRGATVDQWEDDAGRSQWSVRIVAKFAPLPDEGELIGRTMSGELVGGHVSVEKGLLDRGTSHEALVEFHGSGDLSRRAEVVAPGPLAVGQPETG
jgi:hypothetical protein